MTLTLFILVAIFFKYCKIFSHHRPKIEEMGADRTPKNCRLAMSFGILPIQFSEGLVKYFSI